MPGTSHAEPVIVVMGASGCGKSTVGLALAGRLGVPFQEGDDLHPASNVEKMRAGVPLADEDRWPWLDRVAAWIEGRLAAGGGGVIACSALKRTYRERLARRADVRFVYLVLDRQALAQRLAARHGHYMPAALLASQLETLEEPGADERVIRVDAGTPAAVVIDRVQEGLAGVG